MKDIEKLFEELTEEKVMSAAAGCKLMDEVMVKLGLPPDEEHIDAVIAVAPLVERLLDIEICKGVMKRAVASGDAAVIKGKRLGLLRALWLKKMTPEEEMAMAGRVAAKIYGTDEVVPEPVSGVRSPGHFGDDEGDDPDEGDISDSQGPSSAPGVEDEKEIDIGDLIREDAHVYTSFAVSEEEVPLIPGGTVMKKDKAGSERMSLVLGAADRRVRPLCEVEKKDPKQPVALAPLAPGDLACPVIAEDVLGYTGEEYCGRKVVMVVKRPHRFGADPLKRELTVRLTLHKGILNQMEVRDIGRAPSPYWAVMDAACDLPEGFTAEQVIAKAMVTLGDDEAMGACRTAWYVLKSHQTHPKERYRGMAYIVDDLGGRKMRVRARRADETQQSFDAVRVQKKTARDAASAGRVKKPRAPRKVKEGVEVPLATHVVSEVK